MQQLVFMTTLDSGFWHHALTGTALHEGHTIAVSVACQGWAASQKYARLAEDQAEHLLPHERCASVPVVACTHRLSDLPPHELQVMSFHCK